MKHTGLLFFWLNIFKLINTYKSFRLLNLASSAGNFPVKAFDESILKKYVIVMLLINN